MCQGFINWTEALLDYFFSREENEEVFLYVDKSILDQIGRDNGLGDHNDFVNTFQVPSDKRINLYDELFLHENGYKPRRNTKDNQLIKSPNILNFATFLEDKFRDTPYYFPYTVLVMYYACQARNENESTLRGYIQNKLDITDYSPIKDLFSSLHYDFPEFKNKLKTNEKIAGRIKYQLLLSPAEIREINEALYRISYEDDNNLSYVDKILKIKDYVNDHVKAILKESLSNSDYQYRINNIFETFDLDSYRKAHQNQTPTSVLENFALYLDFSEGRGFRLLSSYRPSGKAVINQGDNHFTFMPSIDSIDSYNNEFVELNGNEFVELKEYSLRTQNLEIKPITLGNVIFFYKQREGGYIQSRNSYNKKLYIFVKKDRKDQNIEQWENWADQNATNCKRIDETYDVSDLTQERWALYSADGLTAPYYTKQEGWNLINKVRSISKRGGIKCGNNVYLVNALPYFEFPDDINEHGLKLIVEKEDNQLSHNVDYRFFIQGNKLIIDLIKDIDYEESRLIEVTINYTNPKNNEQLTPDTPDGKIKFYVRGQNIVYNQNELYSFNNWGVMNDRDERHIQGNVISGITHIDLGRASHIIEADDFNRDFADKFYFINLLASCIYMEQEGKITRQRLETCIKYSSTRLNIQSNEDGFTTKVISLLVNSGYIAADYRTSHYQAIPPAFTKIPRSFYAGSTTQVWMLTGAYTRKFMKDLDDFCTKNADGRERKVSISIKYRYSKRLDNSRGSMKLLPPIILLGGNFDPEEFKKRFPHHLFDVIYKYDQALEMLSLASQISEYEKTMVTIPRDKVDVSRFVRPKSNEFPRVREDNPYEYNNHIYIEKSGKGDFFEPSISEKWNELFCYYKRNKPFIIKGAQHIYLPEDLRLPSLIQRSLFIMNVGLPAYKKVFICDNPSKMLYTSVRSYKVNDARLQVVYEKLTGNRDVTNNPFIREKVTSSRNHEYDKWEYRMELWTRIEDHNKKIPSKLLILKYALYKLDPTKDIKTGCYSVSYRNVMVSTLVEGNNNSIIQDTFYEKDQVLYKTDRSCNEIMSHIIKNKLSEYNNKGENNPSDFSLPSRDLYYIEEIAIL